MSWFRATALAACLVVLGACGFQPLYGKRDDRSAVADLAAIKINLIEDRVGQQLHNALLDRLNPTGKPVRALYVLTVALDETTQNLAIRKDETATRANLILHARYELQHLASGKVLVKGVSRSVTSFNILESDFATLSAEADARERAAHVISDDIKARLGMYFSAASGGG